MSDYKRGNTRLVALNVDVKGDFLTEPEYVAMRGKLDDLRKSAPDAFRDLQHVAQEWRKDGAGNALPESRLEMLDSEMGSRGLTRTSAVLQVLLDHKAHGFRADHHPGFMRSASGRPMHPEMFNKAASNVREFAQEHPQFVAPLRTVLTSRDANLITSVSSIFNDRAEGRAFSEALQQHQLAKAGSLTMLTQLVAADELPRTPAPAAPAPGGGLG